MKSHERRPRGNVGGPPSHEEDGILHAILEGTAKETGGRFFAALVRHLCQALGTDGAWVTEYREDERRLGALAFWHRGGWIHEYEYDIAGTPCEPVIETACLAHFPENVIQLFPDDPDLPGLDAVSYMGVPLLDLDGSIMGHLAVLDSNPMPAEQRLFVVFRIFADRAAAELRRVRAEERLRERQEQLDAVLNSAMDAILQLDHRLRVVVANPAANRLFARGDDDLVGRSFAALLASGHEEQLRALAQRLASASQEGRQLWIPGQLECLRSSGDAFSVEATLSSLEFRGEMRYTLVLRDVEERRAAERMIRQLVEEAEYLRSELRTQSNFNEIIGDSPSLMRVMRDVSQVASTAATVLILGETGTGKELFARAIHEGSPRRNKSLITINCAAVPASLMESEFFGHEKGAFTGATARREGRFALAHGGTIFLDEVGELSLDLQAKLLRVLQEGEFAPVGATKTRKVDVRVIAATNRDLADEVRRRAFREDLFYRLNVFPIELPPLRERGDDVVLLASTFAERFARKIGRSIAPLTSDAVRRLRGYDWPGNVRELQNVIERAVITSEGGHLNLDRALPEASTHLVAEPAEVPLDGQPGTVLTVRELRDLERRNIQFALEQAGGRVAGAGGAAELLGMNASTLYSRIKALEIDGRRAALSP